MRALLPLMLVLLIVPGAAFATISFTQIDGEVFSVSHRVKVIGSRGKATKMVYTKAASLCVAAGFSHMRILEQESEASQKDDQANASLRVKYYFEDADERLECEGLSDPQYVQEATNKLRKRGYEPPEPPDDVAKATAAATAPQGESNTGSCTIEQVAAMARAGLSDDRIRAACLEDG